MIGAVYKNVASGDVAPPAAGQRQVAFETLGRRANQGQCFPVRVDQRDGIESPVITPRVADLQVQVRAGGEPGSSLACQPTGAIAFGIAYPGIKKRRDWTRETLLSEIKRWHQAGHRRWRLRAGRRHL